MLCCTGTNLLHATAAREDQIQHRQSNDMLLSSAAAAVAAAREAIRPAATTPAAAKTRNPITCGSNQHPEAAEDGGTGTKKPCTDLSHPIAKPQCNQQEVHLQEDKHASPDAASCKQHAVTGNSSAAPTPIELSERLLLPGQHVEMQLLTRPEGSERYELHETPLQLKVVALLGTGGVNEAHHVQQLLPADGAPGATIAAESVPGSCSADEVAAAGRSGGSGIATIAHMALKVPLRHHAAPEQNQKRFKYRNELYLHCSQLLMQEHMLMSQLEGQHGIARCYGYGIPKFELQGSETMQARGLLLEHCELGSLQETLTPEPGVVEEMSDTEAWVMMSAMTHALNAAHHHQVCV
jgi:hypothetical protein